MAESGFIDLSTIKRALVIKLRHFGDVLLTTPVFSALQKALPQAKIDAFIYGETYPILQGNPYIHHFHLCNPSSKRQLLFTRFLHDLRFYRSVRDCKYDLVLNLTEGDRGAMATHFSKAPYRVGWGGRQKGLFTRRDLYTHVIKKGRGDRHVVEINLDALRRIGIHPSLEERQLYFSVPVSVKAAMEAKLKDLGVPKDYVVVHPTSRWLFKCLPETTVAKLLTYFKERGIAVVLTSAPNEKELEMVSKIERLVPKGSFYSLAGQLNFQQMGALIAGCLLFVGVDSAPMHLAAALRKKTVAVFGPSSERAWGPWQTAACPFECQVVTMPYPCRPCGLDGCGGGKVSDCLQSLPLSDLLAAVEKLLEPIFHEV